MNKKVTVLGKVLELREDGYTWEGVAKFFERANLKKTADAWRKWTATKTGKRHGKKPTEKPIAHVSIDRFKKQDIIWMENHYCKHGFPYIQHTGCYLKERGQEPKVGFLDIESSGLKANFAVCYCYCIKVLGSDEVISRTITSKELKSKGLDKPVIEQAIKDIMKFDKIVTYYGTGFDIPFLRTRALMHGLEFPKFGALFHEDIYYTARNKLCLHSKRLAVVEEALLGEAKKTVLEFEYWIRALGGDKKSLDYISHHCKMDVLSLEEVWKKLIGFKKHTNTSA